MKSLEQATSLLAIIIQNLNTAIDTTLDADTGLTFDQTHGVATALESVMELLETHSSQLLTATN